VGTHYVIHKSADHKIDIHAEKINLGVNRLWFYDADDNLQAVFRWNKIKGFSVEGPTSGQIVIENLAHESKISRQKIESLERTYGPLLAALETADQALRESESILSSVWLKMYNAKKNTTETRLLLSQRRGDLLRYQARLQDCSRDLEAKIKRISDEIMSVLASDK
jgi:hypothetical protein